MSPFLFYFRLKALQSPPPPPPPTILLTIFIQWDKGLWTGAEGSICYVMLCFVMYVRTKGPSHYCLILFSRSSWVGK